MASLIKDSFGASGPTGFTISKLLEAIRLIGGPVVGITLSDKHRQDLAHQSTVFMDQKWVAGQLVAIAGIPLEIRADWGHPYVFGEDGYVKVECVQRP